MKTLVPGKVARNLGMRWRNTIGVPVDGERFRREFYLARGSVPQLMRGQVEALSVRKWYNFGNMTRQLVNAVDFAHGHGISTIVCPPSPWFVNGELRDVAVEMRFGSSRMPATLTLEGTFFYPQILGVEWEAARRARILRELRSLLNVESLAGVGAEYDLVIHLRSGDVFGDNPHPEYWPPPLSYYLGAIVDAEASSVLLVVQDRVHPYLGALAGWAASRGVRIDVQSGSAAFDIATLMAARHVCLSQGTMGLAAAWLSSSVERVYAPSTRDTGELGCLGIDVRAPSGYAVPGSAWRATSDQVASLLADCTPMAFHPLEASDGGA